MTIKKLISFIILFTTWQFCYAQDLYKESNEKIDSVDYYLELANFNKEDKNSYNKAILYCEKAIEYAKENNLNTKLPDCYLMLGEVFNELNKSDNAIEYFIRSVNIYNKEEPKPKLALAYYNLGKCYLKLNKHELSELYFKKSAAIYESFDLTDAIELINLQKGIIQSKSGKITTAQKTFLEIISKYPNFNYNITAVIEAYIQLGKLELDNKNTTKAISYFEEALNINKENSNRVTNRKNILMLLGEAYSKNNEFEKSNLVLHEYIRLNDSLNKNFSDFLTSNTYAKIELDKQLKTIETLDKEKKNQLKTIRFSKLISILSIALISILSLLSLSLYKNNKIRISTNQLLKEKNRELRKEKEKVERASKARSEFLATVSHELRTPLNAINGITYLLLQENPKKSQLNYLNSLQFSGNYLLNFINDILEINRLESDKVVVEKISFNINELIDNIKNSFNEYIVTNNVRYHQNIDNNITYNIVGDPTKLSQILINLINNAIKFSKNGDVWFEVKEEKIEGNFVTIAFEVKDNGIGIALDKQKDIFDSFSQGSIEINRTYGGTGLGLSIVKRLLEILNSDITLTSEPGKGTTFTFNLVFEKGTILEKKVLKNTSLDAVFENKKVLLVEDNKINQMITKKMVEKKGMECFIIDNGEEAIEHLKENNYDIILMDVHLPGINGTEATATIRSFNNYTPIIALTAISLNENREMLLSFGMNDVITKPFDPDNFYEIVASYLNNSK